MTKNTLGTILLQAYLISRSQLNHSLEKQQQYAKELCWKLLGEILVEDKFITKRELSEAIDRQGKLTEVEFFGIKIHPSIRSKSKRIIDILGAIVEIVIMITLFPIIAVAIYLDCPGPIFFSQPRLGFRGKQFRVWKFRTMVPNAEMHKLKLIKKQGYKFFDHRNDPRRTRVGKILRKTHLDEMPQFFNVLKGDMSLVGTRPPTLDEVKAYSIINWQRLSIKPGMTGLWQIHDQKYKVTFDKVVELDMLYIEHWGRWLDIQIIAATVVHIFFGIKQDRIRALQGINEQKKVCLLNLMIDNISLADLLKQLKSGVVLTPNVDHVMKLQKDADFFKMYSLADYKICDSQILLYASRFLGTPLKEKISGSDFFPTFCKFHKYNESIKIFLLGGGKGIANRAQNKINNRIGRNIVVDAHSPSFGFDQDEQECLEIVEKINQSQATVLALGVGAPKQEKWIYKYKDKFSTVRGCLKRCEV